MGGKCSYTFWESWETVFDPPPPNKQKKTQIQHIQTKNTTTTTQHHNNTTTVAAAPRNTNRRVQTLRELDNDIKYTVPSATVRAPAAGACAAAVRQWHWGAGTMRRRATQPALYLTTPTRARVVSLACCMGTLSVG